LEIPDLKLTDSNENGKRRGKMRMNEGTKMNTCDPARDLRENKSE